MSEQDGLNAEVCAESPDGRHRFGLDGRATWIDEEESYQAWGKCEACDRSAWFVLTPVPALPPVTEVTA